jgi:hypothetical protein
MSLYALLNIAASAIILCIADPGPFSKRTVALCACLAVANLSGYFEGYAKANA